MSRLLLLGIFLYLGLFGFNVVTRTGYFPRDGMNYVDVARNIANGRGITQSTLGYNQNGYPSDAKIPAPLIVQAPLYPILVAIANRVGISAISAALLVSVFACAITLLAAYQLADTLYDNKTAVATSGVLLFYEPLRSAGRLGLADALGAALVFVCLWLLVKGKEGHALAFSLLAGIAAGLAFAARYPLIPLIGISVLFLVIEIRGWQRKLASCFLCALGFLVPAGPVWIRNFFVSGSPMPSPSPQLLTLVEKIVANRMLLERYLGDFSPPLQIGLLGLTLVVFSTMLIVRRQFAKTVREILFSRGRYLLPVWTVVCLAFLVYVRSHSYATLEERFLLPAGVALVILWTALAVTATRVPEQGIRMLVVSLIAIAIGREAAVVLEKPPLNSDEMIGRSPRLVWLRDRTTDEDLIIGNDTVDIPFFLGRKAAISFSTFPYTEKATYDRVMACAQTHCGEYRNIYLVVRIYPATEEQWRQWYGDLFADLVFGQDEKYGGVRLVERLPDACIFRMICR